MKINIYVSSYFRSSKIVLIIKQNNVYAVAKT